jgi:hypothetical protein
MYVILLLKLDCSSSGWYRKINITIAHESDANAGQAY